MRSNEMPGETKSVPATQNVCLAGIDAAIVPQGLTTLGGSALTMENKIEGAQHECDHCE